MCESNTPRTLFTPHYGFEDRGAHQDPSASKQRIVPALVRKRKTDTVLVSAGWPADVPTRIVFA